MIRKQDTCRICNEPWRRCRCHLSLVATAVFAALLLSLACGGSKREVRPPVQVEVTEHNCIDGNSIGPAPQLMPIVLDVGGKDGCPDKYEFCASMDAALRLAEYLESIHYWAARVEAACGPEPDPDTPEGAYLDLATIWIAEALMPRAGKAVRIQRRSQR